jgi:hypothetical protein
MAITSTDTISRNRYIGVTGNRMTVSSILEFAADEYAEWVISDVAPGRVWRVWRR